MKYLWSLFVSKELAKTLTEKKFDKPCLAHYFVFGEGKKRTNSELFIGGEFPSVSEKEEELQKNAYHDISVPLYQQVIDWLREVHNIEINIMRYTYEGGVYKGKCYMWYVDQHDPKYNNELAAYGSYLLLNERKSQGYDFHDYYEALTEAIKAALSLI